MHFSGVVASATLPLLIGRGRVSRGSEAFTVLLRAFQRAAFTVLLRVSGDHFYRFALLGDRLSRFRFGRAARQRALPVPLPTPPAGSPHVHVATCWSLSCSIGSSITNVRCKSNCRPRRPMLVRQRNFHGNRRSVTNLPVCDRSGHLYLIISKWSGVWSAKSGLLSF